MRVWNTTYSDVPLYLFSDIGTYAYCFVKNRIVKNVRKNINGTGKKTRWVVARDSPRVRDLFPVPCFKNKCFYSFIAFWEALLISVDVYAECGPCIVSISSHVFYRVEAGGSPTLKYRRPTCDKRSVRVTWSENRKPLFAAIRTLIYSLYQRRYNASFPQLHRLKYLYLL